jgi:hypothetical protein
MDGSERLRGCGQQEGGISFQDSPWQFETIRSGYNASTKEHADEFDTLPPVNIGL